MDVATFEKTLTDAGKQIFPLGSLYADPRSYSAATPEAFLDVALDPLNSAFRVWRTCGMQSSTYYIFSAYATVSVSIKNTTTASNGITSFINKLLKRM